MAADCESVGAMLPVFSSMKVSAMKLLTMEGLTGAYDLDQRTTPDVVRTSKASNMLNERVAESIREENSRNMVCEGGEAWKGRGGGRGREKVGDGIVEES